MPYPLQFRPNQLANLYDGTGALVTPSANCQLMKPMLAFQFNKLPEDIQHLGLAGGVIQRFVIQDNTWADLPFGPSNWGQSGLPAFTLQEEHNQDFWYVFDATEWALGTDLLVSGFASKKRLFPDQAVPVVIPAGSVAPLYTSPELVFGRAMKRTFPAAADEYYLLHVRWDQPFSLQTISKAGTGLIVRYRAYDGYPGAIPAGAIIDTGAGGPEFVNRTFSTSGAGHVGRTMFFRITNQDPVNAVTLVFVLWNMGNSVARNIE